MKKQHLCCECRMRTIYGYFTIDYSPAKKIEQAEMDTKRKWFVCRLCFALGFDLVRRYLRCKDELTKKMGFRFYGPNKQLIPFSRKLPI